MSALLQVRADARALSEPLIDIAACADWIEALQRPDGAIPWVEGGIWDPWNHGESAMALAVAGRETAARKALDALADRQDPDGGWTAELGASAGLDEAGERFAFNAPLDTARDTNFIGYCAVTLLRIALALGAPDLLSRHGAMVFRALDFVLARQSPQGEIVWRDPDPGEPLEAVDALRAGNASLFKSLECGARIARQLSRPRPDWMTARSKIARALLERPERFDRTGIDRSRYAMDWYYPILAGVVTGAEARARLRAGWDRYVLPELGCRCVDDEPWVTAAETAELALACLSAGQADAAWTLLSWCAPFHAEAGGAWMGWQSELEILWPKERPSWTAGALILAADALEGLKPGWGLLIRHAPW